MLAGAMLLGAAGTEPLRAQGSASDPADPGGENGAGEGPSGETAQIPPGSATRADGAVGEAEKSEEPSRNGDADRGRNPEAVRAGEMGDTGGKTRSGWSTSPIVSYAPETDLGLGAFGVHFFRLGNAPAQSRASSVAVVALYTTRGQFIGELIPELYWANERFRLWSKLDYRHYPNALWGVGGSLPDDQEEWYLESGPRWQLWLRSVLFSSLYLEVRLDNQHMSIGDVRPGGLLDTGAVPGARGGNTAGEGLTVGWDSRDHPYVPRRGAFHELSIMSWQRAMGSRYDFARIDLNLRQYLPVLDSHTLALQLYAAFLTGEPPFYRMALLGGQNLLRGYFEGRYRDNNLLAAQAEYRFPLFWRISAVAFAAAGDVAPRLSRFGLDHVRWAAGGGLRLLLSRDEKLNLRFDAAAGPDTYGFYATANEAF